MRYPKNQKINGVDGYNGFNLDNNKWYLKYRLHKVSAIMAKAVDLNLQAYHFIVDSKCASLAADKIRKLNNQACCYIDYEHQNGLHELIIFSRETVVQIEKVLNKHYQEFECCGEYNLADNMDFMCVVDLCFSYCEDNETDGNHKRYFCPSQLTDIEKKREIKMMPMAVDKAA